MLAAITWLKWEERKMCETRAERCLSKWQGLCGINRGIRTRYFNKVFVNNQLDAQFVFLYLFIPVFYMFRATKCWSSGESIVSIRPLVYVGDRVVCRFGWNLHTTRSPTYSDVHQKSYWYSWLFWWSELGCSKHVENRNEHTWKRIVRQVGYLQRLW